MNRLLAYVASNSFAGDMTDYQLLRRFTSERYEPAFAELVRRHGPLVWGVCRRNLWNQADAEDAFQATFLVLLRRAIRFRSQQQVGPWLYKVAVWCCRNIRRGNQRRLSRVGLGLNVDCPAPDHNQALFPALDAAVLSLPEKYRVPIVLCHLQGLSRQQVAEYLGCPEGTLSARLSRALAKLRVKLTNHDPAALLAIAGALAAPVAIANAAIRAATVYATATGSVPQAILSTSDGVLRMFRLKKLQLATAALVAIFGVSLIGGKLAAGLNTPDVPASDNSTKKPVPVQASAPTLVPGKWELVEFPSPYHRQQVAVLRIGVKDGQPSIIQIEDDYPFKWQPKNFTVADRRVTFSITRNGDFERHFDGLFDPSDPNRVLGSLQMTGGHADRALLELVPAAGVKKRAKASVPSLWRKYLDLRNDYGKTRDELETRQSQSKSPIEQAKLRFMMLDAESNYYSEVSAVLHQLAGEKPPTNFAYEAVMELFGMLDRLKPEAAEVATLAKTAQQFAATHGLQFEAYTVGEIALKLTRVSNYAEQARRLAADADKLATAAGLPAKYSEPISEYDAERAAWASQANPPKDDAIWTVTVSGRVTDEKGNPISDTEVLVNNTQWVSVVRDGDGWKTKSGPDGRYTITLKCQGRYRLHVTKMWAEKSGYVRAENSERHKLLPGQTANVDLSLARGEPFGATLKVRLTPFGQPNDQHFLTVSGSGVDRTVLIKIGERFELTLPAGEYSVELDRGGGKKLTWSGLKTGRTDHVLEEPPFRFTLETIGDGFDQMWTEMDRSYSYFTIKPDVDWKKLKDEYRPKAIQAKSADELAATLKEMLAHLNDGHVWIITPDGKQIGTHPVSWSFNGNRKVVMDQLTDTTKCGDFAIVGKTKPDGFGYFLMTRQSAATPELVKKAIAAIKKLADAPAFFVDLRNANGGNELLAQDIAQQFCKKKVIYAKSRYRNGKEHDEFGEDQPRWLEPAKSGKPYLKPVVCLLGPGCVSSGEGFAKMMAALPQVTTIGLPTRGSSGNPGPVEVGETGISVYFSRWVDMLPDGTPIEGKGVPPAIRVDLPAKAYQDSDPTLTKALEVLRAKTADMK